VTGKQVSKVLRVLWVVMSLTAAVAYLAMRFPSVEAELSKLPLERLILGFGLILLGKLLLTGAIRSSFLPAASPFAYGRLLVICSVSQLGKYLPGSIWHFVGRASVYRSSGMQKAAILKALLLENSWLVLSAVAFGAPAILLSGDAGRSVLRGAVILLIGLLLCLVLISVAARVLRACSSLFSLRHLPTALQYTGTWASFGVAFWLIAPPATESWPDPILAAGAFSLAWVVGFLVPIAPAGIGIREAVLVALLGRQSVDVDQAVILSTVSRLLWTSVELLLGAASAFSFYRGPGKRDDHS